MIRLHSRLATTAALLLAALTASCGGDVTLPVEGEAAELVLVDGNEQVGPAGTDLASPVVVRVVDVEGRPVPSIEVDFVVESGGGAVEPAAATSGSDGLATATWTLGPGAGSQRLSARTPRGGDGSLLEVEFTATAVAGSGSVLVGVRGDDQTGPVSSALADSLVVKATDALGNPVANVEVTWSVSGGGSISPATVVTGTDGLAAAERVLGATSGAQSAQAAVPGYTGSPVSFSHTAQPANPTALVLISGDDQSAPAGFPVAEDLVVRLQDPNGNGIGGRPITWVVPSGSGSVDPVSVQTDANGLARTRWTMPNAAGDYTVSAVFSGLQPVVFSATATSDAPTTIAMVSGNGQSGAVGTALANPLVVRVTDANSNPVPGVSVAWTAEDGGSVSADNTATDAQGLARVTRTLGLLPGQYTTTAAVPGLQGSPITFVSTATAGPPAQLAIITQPGSPTVSGTAFTPSPVLQVQDAQGNNVQQGGVVVVVTITAGPPGATLENDTKNTNANGRVTFNNLLISGPPADTYVLTFTGSLSGVPLTPVSTGPLSVTAGGAARLVLTQQPSASAQSGVQFAQQPTVQVVDGTGNPVTGNRTIEVEIQDGAGTLQGTLTASTGGGSTASFTNLAISGLVGSRTLLFSSGALTPVESNAIDVTTGPAATISIQAGNDQTAAAGTELPTDPAVLVRDSGGNPVGGVEVTFAATTGGGSVDPTTANTAANGIAATNWTLGAAGANQMTATASVGTVTFDATATSVGSTTSLDAQPDPPAVGATNVTFTATVASTGGGTPTGNVEFRDGAAVIGTDALDGGVAEIQALLDVGSHSITANYLGDGTFAPSSSSALSYEVTASNSAPVANPDAFGLSEDGSLIQGAPGVLANDTDADGDGLTAQVIGGPPANGSLTFNANGSFTYTPDPDFNGADQFSYRANDGAANSAVVAVTLTVAAVNDPPSFTAGGPVSVNTAQALSFSEQWATGIGPGPPDEAGQVLTFSVTLDNPADASAFMELPQISSTGTLTFEAVALVLVSPRVIPMSVTLSDDAGGSTTPVVLSLTITPVLGP